MKISVTKINSIQLITCPPESFDTGETAKDMTGSGTFMEVIVYLTEPSVKVSPKEKHKNVLNSISKNRQSFNKEIG